MKAIVQDRYGSPDVLSFTDVPTPRPSKDDDVLIRVRAASVNARDWHVMRGDPYVARLMAPDVGGLTAPKQRVRGTDFAGVVESVGASVTHVRPGDAVFGEAPGAFAEYVVAPRNAVAGKPASMTFEQAAALPLAGNTALLSLVEIAGVEAGQTVLINGASGGVGTYAVQLAAAHGATVTAVCSTRNVELVESLGAHDVVDYRKTDFRTRDRQYDVVFDLVGNRSLRDLKRSLTPTGTLLLSGGGVSTGGTPFGPMKLIVAAKLQSRFVKQRIEVPEAKPSTRALTELGALVEEGRLTSVIDRTYALAAAADAIRYLETDHARAKVVLTA
ncbi:NAD(P)-dependent alcohol dehydrogenase [Cryptosporangium phraense]|uniref:NAD(P)-dependent alcohol dehydrogenase n=1 Tax=Cryptosporangium phraense TaxID=2593070 RepID=A0A545AZR4_9ACTN|nr:NAD(P)-dependent alcohol dehydrogenase [Cryptosporangium phraense]TQS46812.1 NAD(P)-dependent alcohol dehydrogenase [Cryptosporangium phraense]